MNIKSFKLNRIIIFVLIVTFILLGFSPTQFADLAITDVGLINVHVINTFNQQDLPNIKVNLYCIKEINNVETMASEYTSEFSSLTNLNEDADDYIEKITTYIKDNNITGNSKITNTQGKVFYKDLKLGTYLITVDNFKIDNKDYQITPFIVNLPTIENNEYLLNINATPKMFEIKEPEVVPPEDDGNTISNSVIEDVGFIPKTGDGILFDVFLLSISILVLIVLYFPRKKDKK